MDRVKVTETVYDVLHDAGLSTDHACFDDLMFGALFCIEKGLPAEKLTAEIAAIDADERGETDIAMDLVDYAKACHLKEPLADVIRRAVAQGKGLTGD